MTLEAQVAVLATNVGALAEQATLNNARLDEAATAAETAATTATTAASAASGSAGAAAGSATTAGGHATAAAASAATAAAITTAGSGEGGNGSATAPFWRFATDLAMGMYRISSGVIGWAVSGVRRMSLSATTLQVDVPITGTAVQSTATDATSGRLMPVGAFGLGAGATSVPNLPTPEADAAIRPGLYQFYQSQDPLGGNFNSAVAVLGCGFDTGSASNLFLAITNTTSGSRLFAGRKSRAAPAIEWSRIFTSGSLVGTVSETGGVPTGAGIERGSNGNGSYVRYADGTMICWRTLTASASAAVTWTFPAAFVAAPVVSGKAVASVLAGVCLDSAPTTTTVALSARDKADGRRADVMHLTAVGHWF